MTPLLAAVQHAAQVRAWRRYMRHAKREARHARFHRVGLNGTRAVIRRQCQMARWALRDSLIVAVA